MATKAEGRAADRRAKPKGAQGGSTRVKKPTGGSERDARPELTEDRRRRIAEEAYYRAERRGFAGGFEDSDWLEAEKEIDTRQDAGKREPGRSAGARSGKARGKPAA